MKNKQTFILVGILTFIMSSLSAQMGATVDLETMSAKGKELYFERVSCWVCHSDDASGGVGPFGIVSLY